jgi:starch phosphorylase
MGRDQAREQTKLADLVFEKTGHARAHEALFDIQVKRIHEYKRQLLNVFAIIHRYNALKAMSKEERRSRCLASASSAAKPPPGTTWPSASSSSSRLWARTVNKDPEIGDMLKLVFLPDYNVSSAEIIVPGSELSQHISTAGTEASGTSNMKFAMNGCLIIGTMDGANVEIAEEIGQENMFIFGARADVVPGLRREREFFNVPEEFYTIVDQIRNGYFGWSDFFAPVCDAVCGAQDFYLLANDFNDYIRAQEEVDENYLNQALWTKKSILSVAGSGKFSSDRTIRQYAEDIWDVKPAKRPMPTNPKPYGKPHKM